MSLCFFVSDLHGKADRYRKLFQAVLRERPAAVFLGGDLLPHGATIPCGKGGPLRNFVRDVLAAEFSGVREALGEAYPRVFLILGNDDARIHEAEVIEGAAEGLWDYAHNRKTDFGEFAVYGYAYVPPTPFLLKDWERYDVSRYVDPGCIPPEEGWRTCDPPEAETRFATIQHDLEQLAGNDDVSKAIFLFHTPPYQTHLDRAALDGKMIDHVPVDVHVGSMAVKRFIDSRQPLLTLHGHIHESARLTGSWRERIGETHAFSAAHDGPELALVRFDLRNLDEAERGLV